MAIVAPTDAHPEHLPIGGSREDGLLTVGVCGRSCGGDGSSNGKVLQVQPDLTDVLTGPADGDLAGGGGAVAVSGEVSVVQLDGAPTTN